MATHRFLGRSSWSGFFLGIPLGLAALGLTLSCGGGGGGGGAAVTTAAPVFSVQPVAASVADGGNTSFTVTASDTTTYQWQVYTGAAWANISNGGVYSTATTATLNITAATLAMTTYQYRCVATGAGGTTNSSAAALTVTPSAVSFTTQPSPATITDGGNAAFTVAATGTGTLTYQWQVNPGSTWSNLSDGGVYSTTATATLNITAAPMSMTGFQYRCVVTGTAGSANSSAALLTVNAGAVTIGTQPSPAFVADGGNTNFTVAASGTGTLTYQWQENQGSAWTDLADGGVYSTTATPTLHLTGATVAMNGFQYRCVVTGTAGAVPSDPAALTVTAGAVSFTTQPSPATVADGGAASFTVAATGTGTLTYQWQENQGSGFANLADGGIYSNTATVTLNLSAAAFAMSGYQYRCVVTGTVGPANSDPATLTVTAVLPTFSTQPSAASVADGGPAFFTVVASGTGTLTYRWQENQGSAWAPLADGGIYSNTAAATLNLSAATYAMNTWQYRCVVTGTAGPVISNPAALTVAAVGPIVTAPVATPLSGIISVGSSATFTVSATGTGPLTYRWQQNTGSAFTNLADGGVFSTTATATLLVTTPVLGTYSFRCVVSGPGTSAPSAAAALNVVAPPAITAYTASTVSVAADANVIFNATFTGGTGTVNGTAITSGGPLPLAIHASNDYLLTVTNAASDTATRTIRIMAGALANVAGTVGGFGEVNNVGVNTGATARFSYPAGMVVEGGNVYVVDQGSYNGTLGGTLRKVVPGTTAGSGVVTTVAGIAGVDRSFLGSTNTLKFPYAVAADGHGYLYVADTLNHCIRLVNLNVTPATMTTIAGRPNNAEAAWNDPAGNVQDVDGFWGRFYKPYGVAVVADASGAGYLYVTDNGYNQIKVITLTGHATTLMATLTAGGGGTTVFNNPLGISLDATATNLYVADAFHNLVKQVPLPTPTTTGTVASLPISGLLDPQDVIVALGQLFVVDTTTHVVIQADLDGTNQVVIAGTPSIPGSDATHLQGPTHLASNGTDLFVSDSDNNTIRRIIAPLTTRSLVTIAGLAGNPSRTSFFNPTSLAVGPSGNIYVADRLNSVIRKVTPTGTSTILAGDVTGVGTSDVAPGTYTRPTGLCVDANENVFVADSDSHLVRLIGHEGTLRTISTGSGHTFLNPAGVCVDANGVVYVADKEANNIVKMVPNGSDPVTATYTATVLAGDPGGTGGYADNAVGTSALFNQPNAVAVDAAGTVYVADSRNNNIRTVTATGVVSTYAGINVTVGPADPIPGFADGVGAGATAIFNNPMALALDSTLGYLYVADTNNAAVRRITLTGPDAGQIRTVIGSVATPILESLTGNLPTNASALGLALGNGQLYLAVDDAILKAPF